MVFDRNAQLSTADKIARALGGFGAGYQGRGAQYLQAQQQRDQQLSMERKKAAADDLVVADQLLKNNDLQGLRDLALERVGIIEQLGGDPSDTMQIATLSNFAALGDQDAMSELKTQISRGIEAGQVAGLIAKPAAQERFEDVLDDAGNIIGQRSSITGRVVDDPRAKLRKERVRPVFDNEGRIIGQEVVATGEVKSDPRTEALRKQEQVEAKAQQAGEAEEAATAAIQGNIANLNDTLAMVDRLETHPGFESAVGAGVPGLRFVPGTDTADFSALVDTLKARLGFDELQRMRASSPTGGALGQVTERELAFLQSAIQNLALSQSEAQYKKNLKGIRNSIGRFRGALEKQVEDAPQQVIKFDAQGKEVTDG